MSISTRLKALEGFRRYDEADHLRIAEHAEELVEKEIDEYIRKIPDRTAVELDLWLSDLTKVVQYREEVIEVYRVYEVKYFSMCINLIKQNYEENIVEDVIHI